MRPEKSSRLQHPLHHNAEAAAAVSCMGQVEQLHKPPGDDSLQRQPTSGLPARISSAGCDPNQTTRMVQSPPGSFSK